MSNVADFGPAEIADYYDTCGVDYAILWHLKSKMAMHYGYWEPGQRNLRHALEEMNRRVAAFAGIMVGNRVLDAGCGVGGSSIFLAKTFGCHTDGITLSAQQVVTCRANARRHRVGGQCRFHQQSYLSTGFPDQTFDVVWGIESVCYAEDKVDFLREAYRVLKPGGRVVVADFFTTGTPALESDRRLLRRWTDSWVIPAYADRVRFWEDLHSCGFVDVKREDVTQKVRKSISRLLFAFVVALPIGIVFRLVGARNQRQTANLWSAFYQYQAYRRGLWRYVFFAGTKPMSNL